MNKKEEQEKNEYIEKLHDCFTEFDDDGDNYVQAYQLPSMIEYLHFPLPDDFVEKTYIQFQLKDNQKFDFDKFCEFLAPRHRETQIWQKLHDSFQVFDNEGNGKISISELAEILTTFGDVFTKEEIQHMKAVSKPDANDLIDINLITDLLVDDMLDNSEEEEEEEDHHNISQSNLTDQYNEYNQVSNGNKKGYSDYKQEYSYVKEYSNNPEEEYVVEYDEEEIIDNRDDYSNYKGESNNPEEEFAEFEEETYQETQDEPNP